ncbi:MliC family protein [Terricaulis sp.]|uniref:MliC family protein n=1 Tax=Terricaulis sp. TaxID=2768686 RepID=UPI00378314E3
MKTLVILAAALSLAACATESGSGEAVGAPRTTWRCDGGSSFTVSYTDGSARVRAGGRSYNLPHAVSGSGARYAGGGVQFWEHAGTSTLTGAAGGPYANCRH